MSFFRNVILLVSFSAVCFTGFSQENNESQFLYSIAVKQTFTAWSECGNAVPRFEKAELVMRLSNNPEMPRTIVREELGSMKHFDGGFRGSSDFSKRPLDLQSIDSIAVATWVSEIRNDTKQEYGLKPELWHAGINEPVSRSASDPCSNNANWSGNREGYTVSTTVIVDDPVMIAGLQQEPYDAESEYIVLGLDNGWDIDKVSYNVNGGYIGLDKRKDKRKEQFTRLSTQVFNLSDCKK